MAIQVGINGFGRIGRIALRSMIERGSHSYRISGILKNHILGVIRDGHHRISPMQRGILLREGLTEEILYQLEGGR